MKATMKENKIVVEFEIGKYDQRIMDLLSMIEIANKSKATDDNIKALSDDITTNWWKKNKERLLNENRR